MGAGRHPIAHITPPARPAAPGMLMHLSIVEFVLYLLALQSLYNRRCRFCNGVQYHWEL